VSVARGPDVANVRSLNDLCGLRVKVETFKAPKGLCNANAASALDTSSVNAVMHLGVFLVVKPTHQGILPFQSGSSSAAGAEETKVKTIVVEVSGKKQTRLLQSERRGSTAEWMTSPSACRSPNQLQLSLLQNRRNLAMARTKLSVAAASSRLRLLPALPPLHPTQEDRPSGRLPKRAVNVRPSALKFQLWICSHPVAKRLIQNPLKHSVSLRRPTREPPL
jgi:hypothetical protein